VARVLMGMGMFLAWIGTFMIHPLIGVIVTLIVAALWWEAVRG
jgi:uncharacterized membrane protein